MSDQTRDELERQLFIARWRKSHWFMDWNEKASVFEDGEVQTMWVGWKSCAEQQLSASTFSEHELSVLRAVIKSYEIYGPKT